MTTHFQRGGWLCGYVAECTLVDFVGMWEGEGWLNVPWWTLWVCGRGGVTECILVDFMGMWEGRGGCMYLGGLCGYVGGEGWLHVPWWTLWVCGRGGAAECTLRNSGYMGGEGRLHVPWWTLWVCGRVGEAECTLVDFVGMWEERGGWRYTNDMYMHFALGNGSLMVLMPTRTTRRLGKASKNCPDMEKDGNLIKITQKPGKKWENLGCASLSQYFLRKTTTIWSTANDDHAGSTLTAKSKHQTVRGWWLVHLELASFVSTNCVLSFKIFLCMHAHLAPYCKFQLRTWMIFVHFNGKVL